MMDDKIQKGIETQETSPMGRAADIDMVPVEEDEKSMQASLPSNIIGNTIKSGVDFRELQETNNISAEAYKEFMTTTLKEFNSIAASRALESDEAILQVFHSLPSTGTRVDLSIYRADVPVAPEFLVSLMFDMNSWASSLSHIVCRASSDIPPSFFQKLSSSDVAIEKILMVNAELQLLIPSVKRRSFKFLRLLNEVNRETWIIFDISKDYFLQKSDVSTGQKSWKRRSGLIIKRFNSYSKVIWVESMEAHECLFQDDIFPGMTKSEMGFSAKRWVSTLMWWLKRKDSKFAIDSIFRELVNSRAHTLFLSLTASMKKDFLDILHATPDDTKWVAVPNQKLKLWKSMITNDAKDLQSSKYMFVTTFQLEAPPSEAFDFLKEKNVDLQWPICPESFRGRKEMIKSIQEDDDSNCITLLVRDIYESLFAKKPKDREYLLQEASKDGFCSLILSAPMAEPDVFSTILLGGGVDALVLEPAGFAIVPGRLSSQASLVTMTMQLPCTSDIKEAVERMDLIRECMVMDLQNELNSYMYDESSDESSAESSNE